MAYNGSGTFLINTAGQPVVAGTVISSTTFNALTADLATGLSTVITKDGQTTVTANIPMASFKFTGLGVGSAAGDSANLSQVQSTVTKLLAGVSGADTVTATASPTLAAYAAGQMFYFVAAGDNTTSVTLNIDALGAKAVTRDGSVALAAADIKSGEVVVVVYDGTRFQVVSQLNSAGDARFANVSIASSLYVGGVSTFVGNAGFSANVSIASALSVGGVAAITGATTIGGNLTLSGGTANGVAFLNASKVVTSGSALVFDGTNLGIGTASPANKLNVSGNGYLFALNGGLTNRVAQTFGNTGGGLDLGIEGSAGGTVFTSGASYAGVIGTNNATVLQLGTNGTIRATLDTSGNLGIGTASPSNRLSINDPGTGLGLTNAASGNFNIGLLAGTGSALAYVFQRANSDLLFGTNNTERARITAAGALFLGTTSAVGTETAGSFHIVGGPNNNNTGPFFLRNSFADAGEYWKVGPVNDNGFIVFNQNGTGVFVADGGTSWTGNSDERVKDIIEPITNATAKVCGLRAVIGKYKTDEESKRRSFLIAQDVQAVLPEAVTVQNDEIGTLGLAYTEVIPLLVAAIKELKAELDAAKVKIAALESK